MVGIIIRVNCISPGATHTEGFVEFIRRLAQHLGISYEEMIRRIASYNSSKRITEPAEIAACIVFLASGDSSAVTGQNLTVKCGFRLIHPNEIEQIN